MTFQNPHTGRTTVAVVANDPNDAATPINALALHTSLEPGKSQPRQKTVVPQPNTRTKAANMIAASFLSPISTADQLTLIAKPVADVIRHYSHSVNL